MSKFNDLEEELESLGYGNQWSRQVEMLAESKSRSDASSLRSLKDWYGRLTPEQVKEVRKTQRINALAKFTEIHGDACECGRAFTWATAMSKKCKKCEREYK